MVLPLVKFGVRVPRFLLVWGAFELGSETEWGIVYVVCGIYSTAVCKRKSTTCLRPADLIYCVMRKHLFSGDASYLDCILQI